HELAWMSYLDPYTAGWYHLDVSNETGAPTAAVDSSLASLTYHTEPRIYYVAADQTVHELAWMSYLDPANAHWYHLGVGAEAGAPPVTPGSTLGVTTYQTEPRVYYLAADRHVHELAWTSHLDPANAGWTHLDLTEDVQGPLAFDGSALSVTSGGGGPLTARLIRDVSHGTLSLDPNGAFLYTPETGYSGADSFSYVAHNGAAESAEATVHIMVMPDPCAQVDGNQVNNFCFAAGSAPWRFHTDGRGVYNTVSTNPFAGEFAAEILINEPGSNVQFFQPDIALQPNTRYVLSFAAYSSNGNDMSLYLHKHGRPYTGYGLTNRTVDLTTSWQVYTLEFTTPNVADMNDGRLRFWFAPFDVAGAVYHIDRVVLRPSGGSPLLPDPDPLAPVVPPLGHCDFSPTSVIVNGGFEGELAPWRFWSDGRGTFDVGVDHYECAQAGHVRIDVPGANVQLFQHGITLAPQTTYRLRLAARSSSGRDVSLFLHKHTEPFTKYGLNGVVLDLTRDWQTFTVQFTTPDFAESVNDARLRIWLAADDASGEEYWFDDAVMQRLDSANDAAATVTSDLTPQVGEPYLISGYFIDDNDAAWMTGAEIPANHLVGPHDEQPVRIYLPFAQQ
ncbi:MAG: carbohydrate binding domain-containing protein, partial [Caldilineaceae bacterium]|nr:carbohydrate binding domain-containing protein [Caldilineaceae bacterium]